MLGLASSLLLLFGCGKDKAAETPPASPSSSAASPSATPSAPTPSASKTPKPKPIKASDNFDKVQVTRWLR